MCAQRNNNGCILSLCKVQRLQSCIKYICKVQELKVQGFLPSINSLANSSLALRSFTSDFPRGFHEEAKAFRVTWISLACMRMAEAWPWNATLNASSRGRSSAAATATHSNVISPATLSSAAASQIPTARLASTTGVQHTDAMQVQIRAQVTFA